MKMMIANMKMKCFCKCPIIIDLKVLRVRGFCELGATIAKSSFKGSASNL